MNCWIGSRRRKMDERIDEDISEGHIESADGIGDTAAMYFSSAKVYHIFYALSDRVDHLHDRITGGAFL